MLAIFFFTCVKSGEAIVRNQILLMNNGLSHVDDTV